MNVSDNPVLGKCLEIVYKSSTIVVPVLLASDGLAVSGELISKYLYEKIIWDRAKRTTTDVSSSNAPHLTYEQRQEVEKLLTEYHGLGWQKMNEPPLGPDEKPVDEGTLYLLNPSLHTPTGELQPRVWCVPLNEVQSIEVGPLALRQHIQMGL